MTVSFTKLNIYSISILGLPDLTTEQEEIES